VNGLSAAPWRRHNRANLGGGARPGTVPWRREVGVIEDLQALAAWPPGVLSTLDDAFDLGELRGRMSVVQCRDTRVVLFLLDHYVHSDSADELERLILARGLALGEPARYKVPAALLLALSEQTTPGFTPQTGKAERSALAAAFDEIVAWGVRQRASDIHFNLDERCGHSSVRFTIEGQYLLPQQYRAVSTRTMLDMLAVAWMRVRGGNGAVFDPSIEQQGRLPMRIDQQPLMLRWASLAADKGPSVCLRVLHLNAAVSSMTLADLGYLPGQISAFERACQTEGGAILIAGTVGSGKSTTLATLLREVSGRRKLITLEDPVEYVIEHAIQNTLTRELDQPDDAIFDAKLRTIKRSAADDLMIGEIRDAQTGRAFMDLAASGVRVYGTVHTSAARLIPERLASDFIGVSRQLMACPGILKLLVHQVLFARLCEACALTPERAGPTRPAGRYPCASPSGWLSSDEDGLLQRWLGDLGLDGGGIRLRNAQGCEHCRRDSLGPLWGYSGRTVVAEWLAPAFDEDLLACIGRQDQRGMTALLAARKRDHDPASTAFWTLRDCAVHKAAAGLLDAREVLSRFAHTASQGEANR